MSVNQLQILYVLLELKTVEETVETKNAKKEN